jgi:hypothetical protein
VEQENVNKRERLPRTLPGRAWLIAAAIVVISIGVISLVLLGVAVSQHRSSAAATAGVGVLVGILGAATVAWAAEQQRSALTDVRVTTDRLRDATAAARGKRSESARHEARSRICGCLDHAHRAQHRVRRVDGPSEHAALDAAMLEAEARVSSLGAQGRAGSEANAEDRDQEDKDRDERPEHAGGLFGLVAGVVVILVINCLLGTVALGTSIVLISQRHHAKINCLSETRSLTEAIRADPGVADLLTTNSSHSHPQLRLSRAFNADCGNIQIVVQTLVGKLPKSCPCTPPPCQTTCSLPPTPPTTTPPPAPPTPTPSPPPIPSTTAPGSPPTTNRGFTG